MNKFNLFAAIFTILILSCCVTNNLQASQSSSAKDKWEIQSVSIPKTCKLKGKELRFKIKVKNTGELKTTGEKITVKIEVKYNGTSLGEKEFSVTPGKTSPGKSTTLSVLCNNENFTQFSNTAGDKTLGFVFNTISWTLTSLNKNESISVK